jgi:hypothetical protein
VKLKPVLQKLTFVSFFLFLTECNVKNSSKQERKILCSSNSGGNVKDFDDFVLITIDHTL